MHGRVVPHDPALPALDLLFEGEGTSRFIADGLGDLCQRALTQDAIDVTYVRYRPGKSCVVGWAHEDDQGRAVLSSARIFHDDRGEKLLAKEASRGLIENAAGGQGARYRYLEQHRLLLQQFPLDLRLPHLSLATDTAWLGKQFGVESGRITSVPVSYKPWRRCVFRYDVVIASASRSYYAKLFRDDRGAELLRWHEIINDTLAQHGAPWSIPPAKKYIPEARMLLFDAVDDSFKVRRLLRQALKEESARDQLLGHIRAAANGLPALQQAQINDLPSETPADVVSNFRRDSEGIPAVAPELFALVSKALDHLEALATRLPPEPFVTTHGAFRHDQMLYADGQLVVLDLDTLCRSGASADAGNFIGYLDLTAIRRPRLRPIIDSCIETFVRAFAANRHTTREWRMWYRAAAHVKKALRSFFAIEHGWPGTAQKMLSLAEATLRSGNSS